MPIQPAGFDRRFIAYLLDGVFLSIVSVTVSFGIPEQTFSLDKTADTLVRSAILAAVSLTYFILSWSRLGGSPAQRALGVRTVSAVDGAMLTPQQAAKRWGLLYGVSSLLFALSLLPGAAAASLLSLLYTFYLYITTRRDLQRRGFHDKQSGTIVVRAPF